MTSWLFPANAGPWDGFGSWVAGDGHPSNGCMQADSSFINNLTHFVTMAIGDPYSAWFKVVVVSETGLTYIRGRMDILEENGVSYLGQAWSGNIPITAPGDTGWRKITGAIETAGDTLGALITYEFNEEVTELTVELYFDTIYIGETDPNAESLTFELIHSAGGIPGLIKI